MLKNCNTYPAETLDFWWPEIQRQGCLGLTDLNPTGIHEFFSAMKRSSTANDYQRLNLSEIIYSTENSEESEFFTRFPEFLSSKIFKLYHYQELKRVFSRP